MPGILNVIIRIDKDAESILLSYESWVVRGQRRLEGEGTRRWAHEDRRDMRTYVTMIQA